MTLLKPGIKDRDQFLKNPKNPENPGDRDRNFKTSKNPEKIPSVKI